MMDCLKCGACCRVFGIVEVEGDDDMPWWLTVPTELGYRRMRTAGFTCVCLCKDNRCCMYHCRPEVCKRFAPGSELCKMARKQDQLVLREEQ